MSTNALLAWRNWAAEYGVMTTGGGDFEANAPATNLLTPRLGEKAIRDTGAFGTVFLATWADGRPVQMVGLLAHNIISSVSSGSLTFELTDEDSEVATIEVPVGLVTASADFQSHLFLVIDETVYPDVDFSKIISAGMVAAFGQVITGRRDPVTGVVTPSPFSAGGFWAGPIWHPDRGIKFATPQFGVIEQPRGVRSIGGQFFPQPQARQRTLSAELTLLEESEAFTELQDLAAWSAVSRPVIAIPDISDPELVYRQGIYGYFDNPLNWQHFDATRDDSTAKREYRGNFSITEAL